MRLAAALAMTASLLATSACRHTSGVDIVGGPNVLIILVDDLRWDALGASGNLFANTPNIDLLAADGIFFNNAFVVQSVCSPSRATVLTGLYPHQHGVKHNGTPLSYRHPTIADLLGSVGYETAFIGKWHLGGDGSLDGDFDRWLSFPGQGSYLDPRVNIDGEVHDLTGHITDILTDYAVEFLRQRRQSPFLLIVSHVAVHAPFTPQQRFAGVHASDPIVAPPTFNTDELNKPAFLRSRIIGPDTTSLVRTIRRYRDTLTGVDASVGTILSTMSSLALLDSTLIILTGDNGLLLGEHNLSDKRVAYEESIRIPLILRYPRWFPPATVSEAMALNLDIAPTVLEAVGIERESRLPGESLRQLASGEASRSAFVYQYYRDPIFPATPSMLAVRTERWKYIMYLDLDETRELYDLLNDPLESTNLIDNLKYLSVVNSLLAKIATFRN